MTAVSAREHLALRVEQSLLDAVPDYRRFVVVARRTARTEHPAIEEALARACERLGSLLAQTPLTELPQIQRWRRAFRAVGLDPTKTRPAVEALARRAGSGGIGSLGDDLVDVGTLVSLTHLVPVGMHVLDGLDGDLTLGPARGDETFRSFRGDVERPEPGEIVYRCGADVLTRRWVWKQGATGSVDARSTHLAVNVDLLGDDDGEAAVATLGEQLGSIGVSVDRVVALDATCPATVLAR